MTAATSDNIFARILADLSASGNLRSVPQGWDPERVVDMSSNDYLGLGADRAMQEEFLADASRRLIPLTSSASRLLCGRQDEYHSLESLLAGLYGRPALLFNSGYHANTGLVSSIGAMPRTLIVADRLVHASIIDGIVLSRAPFKRFRHNDINHLSDILAKEAGNYDRVLVIVESVYSMDGDRADIAALVEVKRLYPNVMLYVDEAHAFGVEGPQGLGLTLSSGVGESVDIIVGTFGKACASMGAFAAVAHEVREYLVNTTRSFIFSTALPPLTAAWTEWVIRRMLTLDDRRDHLRRLGMRLHSILAPMQPDADITPGHIQPLLTYDARRALDLSARLLERGYKVLPIRTPTVPPGTERLRFSLSASITLQEIDGLKYVLDEI